MTLKTTLILCMFLFSVTARAQMTCGPEPDIPPDVGESFKGDVEGKAQLFTKLLGDTNLKGTVETSKNEVHQKYNNTDKVKIDNYMAWVSCQAIMSDQKLSASDRIELLMKVYREFNVGTHSELDWPRCNGSISNQSAAADNSKRYIGLFLEEPAAAWSRPSLLQWEQMFEQTIPSVLPETTFQNAPPNWLTVECSHIEKSDRLLLSKYFGGRAALQAADIVVAARDQNSPINLSTDIYLGPLKGPLENSFLQFTQKIDPFDYIIDRDSLAAITLYAFANDIFTGPASPQTTYQACRLLQKANLYSSGPAKARSELKPLFGAVKKELEAHHCGGRSS
jgi:hypothetical protein